MDFRDVQGETREHFAYSGGAFTELRMAGGSQSFIGIFGERTQPLGDGFTLTAGLRLDRWENADGHRTETSLATGAVLLGEVFPDHSGFELSPSAGLAWQATPELVFHVDAQHAFREPTLNELYRPFRVGTTITEANPNLTTEHADSFEVGGAWSRGRLRVTLEGFADRLTDAVANVTLAQGPGIFPLFGKLPVGGVGQQRLNLGRVDTAGAELGVSYRLTDTVGFELSVIDEEATVAAASVEPSLVGKSLPEVPRWNAAFTVDWRPVKRVSLFARIRGTGSEFDDDQNQLPLASAVVADASARFALTGNVEVFVSVDNLGNTRVETADSAAGVYSVAPGRMASVGARVRW